MTDFRQRRGFTLIEVVIAAAVLATIASLSIVTVWRLTGFAYEEVEFMVADAYCRDVLAAVDAQKYSNKKSIDTFTINPKRELLHIETRDIFGREKMIYPLWRSMEDDQKPTCRVDVSEVVSDGGITNKTIAVTVAWWQRDGVQTNLVRRL